MNEEKIIYSIDELLGEDNKKNIKDRKKNNLINLLLWI
jgi:hypothetical protein